MRIFVADGANRDRREYCRQNNIGLLFSPAYYVTPPTGIEYIIDNGAFAAWQRGAKWDERPFYSLLQKIERGNHVPFAVVIPDIVAAGPLSLQHSAEHMHRIPDAFPRYLPVQDGMVQSDIIPHLDEVDGLFIGGTVPWKWRTAYKWAKFAHKNGLKCHIGRVGNKKNYTKAKAVGADSVDGSNPMRHNRLHIIPEWRDDAEKQRHLLDKEGWMMSAEAAVAADRKCA